MSKATVQVMTETDAKKKPQGVTDELRGSRNVQNALRAVATRLKAERVQLAVLLFDDEILVMAQGRLEEKRLREMTSNVLALTASLA